MDRRTFLKATGACAATTAATTSALATNTPTSLAGTSAHSPHSRPINATPNRNPLTLRVASPFPDNLAGPSDQIHKLGSSIKSSSDGRIQLDIASKPETLEQAFAARSEISVYFGPLQWSPSAHPAALFFSGMPHADALSPTDLAAWLTVSGGQAMWDKLSNQLNVKPVLAGHMGEMPSLWSTFPIKSLTDIAGHKIASASAPPDLLRAIGATPVTVPSHKLANAFNTGAIDIAETGNLHTGMSLGLHKVAKHIAKGIFASSGTALALAINTQTWDKLSTADRELITTCAEQNYQIALAENRLLEKPLMTALRDHHQIQITWLEPGSNTNWHQLADTFVAHIAGSDETSAAVNASYSTFKTMVG